MTLIETLRERRGHDFITAEFVNYPPLYAGEMDVQHPAFKTVYAHFFCGDCHWYLIEYDPIKHIAFGFIDPGILYRDDAEFGWFSLEELETILYTTKPSESGGKRERWVVERDQDWMPREVRFAVPEQLHKDWWFGR